MQPTNSKDIMKALSIRLAKREVPSDVLEAVTKRVVHDGLSIGAIDVFPYGIRIDYFGRERAVMTRILADEIYRVAHLFPYGLLADDLYRLQIEINVPELAEVGVRG